MIASLIPDAETKIDKIDAVIDGWIDPSLTLRSAVGENATEKGVIINDHVTPLPAKIGVTGIVDSVRSNAARANEAWQEIEKLQRESAILKFTSERGIIEECVITSAKTTQRTRGLEFMLELQQINRIDIGKVSTLAPAANTPTLANGDTQPAYGRQPVNETGSKEPELLPEDVPTYLDNQGRRRVGNVTDRSPKDKFVEIENGRVTLRPPDKEGN